MLIFASVRRTRGPSWYLGS